MANIKPTGRPRWANAVFRVAQPSITEVIVYHPSLTKETSDDPCTLWIKDSSFSNLVDATRSPKGQCLAVQESTEASQCSLWGDPPPPLPFTGPWQSRPAHHLHLPYGWSKPFARTFEGLPKWANAVCRATPSIFSSNRFCCQPVNSKPNWPWHPATLRAWCCASNSLPEGWAFPTVGYEDVMCVVRPTFQLRAWYHSSAISSSWGPSKYVQGLPLGSDPLAWKFGVSCWSTTTWLCFRIGNSSCPWQRVPAVPCGWMAICLLDDPTGVAWRCTQGLPQQSRLQWGSGLSGASHPDEPPLPRAWRPKELLQFSWWTPWDTRNELLKYPPWTLGLAQMNFLKYLQKLFWTLLMELSWYPDKMCRWNLSQELCTRTYSLYGLAF